MKILIMCSAGMSTSLLVTRMEKYVQESGYENIVIKAVSVDQLPDLVDDFDVFLLGPQVQYMEEWVKGIIEKKGKGYANIPILVYGRVDEKSTFDLARTLFTSKE